VYNKGLNEINAQLHNTTHVVLSLKLQKITHVCSNFNIKNNSFAN